MGTRSSNPLEEARGPCWVGSYEIPWNQGGLGDAEALAALPGRSGLKCELQGLGKGNLNGNYELDRVSGVYMSTMYTMYTWNKRRRLRGLGSGSFEVFKFGIPLTWGPSL